MTSSALAHEKAAGDLCVHCGSRVPAAAEGGRGRYCCTGCEAVAALLEEEKLTGYYRLAEGRTRAVGELPRPASHAWLEPLIDAAEGRVALEAPAEAGISEAPAVCALEVDVQGIHCAACVWLMRELFRREAGGLGIIVNPALGKVRLSWRRGLFDPIRFVRAVERFGYRFGPARKRPSSVLGSLTWRLGVSVALTMNVMLFAVSFYFGLSRADGPLYTLFSRLSLVFSSAVVAVGGWPFFQAAWAGLRARMLHLDLPIALGILVVYATSLVQVALGRGGDLTYFDTLNTFVTLMLLGRFLQQRYLESSRRYLLEDDGAEGVLVRRLEEGRVAVVPAPRVRAGDEILVAPGELCPVDAALTSSGGTISSDWITGEPAPRALSQGAVVPAGSFNAGNASWTAKAVQDFSASPLSALLRAAAPKGVGAHSRFWDAIARRWVVSVVVTALLAFLVHLGAGLGQALDGAVAVLVVTCPCGIGLALPLAYDLVLARLRRTGFFARQADLLDRLVRVEKVVFDKTGTLTLSRLELAEPHLVTTLAAEIQMIAYNLACRSGHPVSLCVADALAATGARYEPEAAVQEVPGHGLSWQRADGLWRFGRRSWAQNEGAESPEDAASGGAVLTHNGCWLATFAVREVLRPGVVSEMTRLAQAGLERFLISGDVRARAARLASTLGIAPENVRAERRPEEKAADVAQLGAETVLYLGDGVNDALAFERALCAGTVAVDRPVLPGKSDFFLVGANLAPLTTALLASRRLRGVARRVLALSLGYNAIAITACFLGLMSPVRAALFMPLSSLSLLLFTVASLRERDAASVRRRPFSSRPLTAVGGPP